MTILPVQGVLLAQAPIEPVHLVHDGGTPETPGAREWAGGGSPSWIWFAAAIVLTALTVFVIRRIAVGTRRDVPTLTFSRLSRRLRLSRAERDLLTSLAATSARAEHPVSLLLSQDAFIRCAAAAAGSGGGPSVEIRELHAKIYRSGEA